MQNNTITPAPAAANAPVNVVPNRETGKYLQVFPDNPDYGYVILESNVKVFRDGFFEKKKRTAIARGEVTTLAEILQEFGVTNWPGRITVQEYVESEIPERLKKRLYRTDSRGIEVPYEESARQYVKRAGDDGIELTLGGERIFRFSEYDASGTSVDISVAHDNVGEVAAYRKARSTRGGANLPGSDD